MEVPATKQTNEGLFDFSEEKHRVNGVAVKSGVSRNGIMYTGEELRRFANTMTGVSIIKDHEAIVDNAVGVVESAVFNDTDESVTYEGWIKNSKLSEQVKDGRVKHVSIGAIVGKLVKESEDADYLIAKDMTCCELSTVVVPGVPGATIQQAIQDSKPIHENVAGISKEQLIKTKEVAVKMEEKTTEPKVEEKIDTEITKMQELKKELSEELKAMKEHLKEVTETVKGLAKEQEEPAKEEIPEEEVKKEEEKAPVVDKTVGSVKEDTTEETSNTGLRVERGDRGYDIYLENFNDEKFSRLRR